MGYLLAALLGGLLAFNTAASPHRASKMAESALRQRFPGATVKVDIDGRSGFPVIHGQFKTVRIEMSHVKMSTQAGVPTGKQLPMQTATAPVVSSDETAPPPAMVTAGASQAAEKAPPTKTNSVGHTDRFDLVIHDLEWNDLHLESVEFSASDVSYDWDKLKNGEPVILNCGPATAHGVVPAASLQALLTGKLKDVKNPQLSLLGGLIRVTGKKTVLYVPVSFTYTAKPEPRDNAIWLVDQQLKAGPESLVPLPAEKIVGNINPIYVFDREGKWPFRVQLTSAQAKHNVLDITGNLQFIAPAPAAVP